VVLSSQTGYSHGTTRGLATSASARSSAGPSTLLPRQVDRLAPPKVQKWITDALETISDSDTRHSEPEDRIRSNSLLSNARDRRAAFRLQDWDRLQELRTVRRRLGREKQKAEIQAKELQEQVAAFMKSKRAKGPATGSNATGVGAKPEEDQAASSSASVRRGDANEADGESLLEQAREVREGVLRITEVYASLSEELQKLLLFMPNKTHPDAPIGSESFANIHSCYLGAAASTLPAGERKAFQSVHSEQGQQRRRKTLSDWEAESKTGSTSGSAEHGVASVKDHVSLSSSLDPSDALEISAGRLAAGPNFPYLVGQLALLEQALLRMSVANAIQRGFHLVSPPIVVKTDIAERCGFNPRGGEGGQTYFVSSSSSASSENDKELCLVGTAEISLAALVAGRTFSKSQLPLKLLAVSPAFRAEDGGRGSQTKGLYRLHQFQKAEMYVVCEANEESQTSVGTSTRGESEVVLDSLLSIQQEVLQSLGLTYRCLDMPTEELGASAFRKYDIEAWMPGRGTWGEVSSASDCLDYQSARLHILHETEEGKGKSRKAQPAATLNATLCATPRLIISLLEQYGVDEQARKMRLPDSLKPHWIGDVSQVQWVATGSDTWADKAASIATKDPLPSSAPSSFANIAKRQLSTWTRSSHSPSLRNERRHFSSSRTSGAPSMYDQLRSRLSALSVRTGTDVASLSASFFILHEITAVLPLFFFFYLFGLFGIGEGICAWFTEAAGAAAEEDAERQGGNESGSAVWNWRRKIGEWMSEGSARTERYARRKGWWGFEKGSHEQLSAAEEFRDGAPSVGAQRTVVAGAFANAVAAYVVTKVSRGSIKYTSGRWNRALTLTCPIPLLTGTPRPETAPVLLSLACVCERDL
jgi:seryl-tRNA synthetase